jgi:hypothetical protein
MPGQMTRLLYLTSASPSKNDLVEIERCPMELASISLVVAGFA